MQKGMSKAKPQKLSLHYDKIQWTVKLFSHVANFYITSMQALELNRKDAAGYGGTCIAVWASFHNNN